MNKLTPGSNMMWSSKFIMPEHRKAMEQQNREVRRKVKPVLDEQEKEEMARMIGDSFVEKSVIEVEVFDPFEPKMYRGIVTQVDQVPRQLRLQVDDDEVERVKLQDIVRVSVP